MPELYITTTEGGVRSAFWAQYASVYTPRMVRTGRLDRMGRPTFRRMTQNEYPADVRMAWVDFVDAMEKSRLISPALAKRVTL